MWKRSINSEERKLTHEIYDLPANLNALVIMINTSVRNIPTTTIQKQWYCVRIFTAWINFNCFFGSTKCFQYTPGHFPFLLDLLSSITLYTVPLWPPHWNQCCVHSSLVLWLPSSTIRVHVPFHVCLSSMLQSQDCSSTPPQKKKILWRTKNWKNNIP